MTDFTAEIRQFCIERRKELNLTQTQLAEKIGVHQFQISRFENGEVEPKLSFFLRICAALDLYFFVSEKEGTGEFTQIMKERWDKKESRN
jgi:predicted transcriptional regulator